MEQQTMTGSGLYILIAVQLLFSMLIQCGYVSTAKSRQAACWLHPRCASAFQG